MVANLILQPKIQAKSLLGAKTFDSFKKRFIVKFTGTKAPLTYSKLNSTRFTAFKAVGSLGSLRHHYTICDRIKLNTCKKFKNKKKEISSSVCNAQHLNAGQNIQQTVPKSKIFVGLRLTILVLLGLIKGKTFFREVF